MEAASIPAPTPQRRRSRGLSERRLAFFMVSPSMLLIALVAAYPIIYALWLSLHEYSVRVAGLSRWAGFNNYSEALSNPDFWDAMTTTLIFSACSVFLEFLIGLAMALCMHEAFKGQGLLRTVVLVPWAVLTVVTAIMWRTIFESPQGFVNSILGGDTVWLGQEPHALIVIIIADVWKTAPFMALLILAGLQTLPRGSYEGAQGGRRHLGARIRQVNPPLPSPARSTRRPRSTAPPCGSDSARSRCRC